MARRKKKEEGEGGHEEWAIPYGDFVTLMLAFFVVMYSISSVNVGKYRALASSLAAAFNGAPKTMNPINIGNKPMLTPGTEKPNPVPKPPGDLKSTEDMLNPIKNHQKDLSSFVKSVKLIERTSTQAAPKQASSLPLQPDKEVAGLTKMAHQIEHAIAPLIKQHLVVVKRSKYWLEVEIKTDVLFQSGVAKLSPKAIPILERLAGILKPFPNPIHVEGYTDNVPIHNSRFPSNWQLSASRAASVAELFTQQGVDPRRIAIIGWSEYRPVDTNSTVKGRNHNRRVTLVILGGSKVPARYYTDGKVAANTHSTEKPQEDTHAHLGSS